jgi:hypothetical protein
MAQSHWHGVDDPEEGIAIIKRQRAAKLAFAVISMIAILAAIGIVLSVAYSDAPDTKPGLQSQ